MPFIQVAEQTAQVKANHKGLVVYNLTDTGGFAAGPYSWDGSQWVTFAGAGGTAYTGTAPVTLTGNAIGLTAGTANGQVLKWNGSQWVAGADANDNTTYTGSTSVVLSGTAFQRAALTGDVTSPANSNATTIANNAVTSAKIADGTIIAADLNQMAATNGQVLKWNGTSAKWEPATDTDTNTTYTGSTSVTLSGTAFQRAALTGDVTSPVNSNATTIANNAVTSAKIADGAVALDDLASNSVNSAKIVDGGVALADLAANSVNSSKIVDASIVNADIANATITQAKLLGSGTVGQVLTTSTANAAPTWATPNHNDADYIIGNEVTNATASGGLARAGSGTAAAPYTLGIADNGVTTARIADNAVTTAKINASAVTSAKIADGTIVNADIANTTIQAGKLVGSGTVGQILTTTTANAAPTWAATDGIVGNEVTNATANRGLVRAGSGTAASPYTLGIVAGTKVGQVLTWNGTTWVAADPAPTTAQRDGDVIKLTQGQTFVAVVQKDNWTDPRKSFTLTGIMPGLESISPELSWFASANASYSGNGSEDEFAVYQRNMENLSVINRTYFFQCLSENCTATLVSGRKIIAFSPTIIAGKGW
jgi:hypothetical protein